MYKFENQIEMKVLSGSTGEVLHEYTKPNAISDDFLCAYGRIFISDLLTGPQPYCFLLPDGANWSGFAFDRSNPWAPYCTTVNNSVDTSADTQWQTRQSLTVTSSVLGQWKLFFQWTNLATDLSLKGIGLTAMQTDINDSAFGATDEAPVIFVPQTLVVLPAAITVHGNNGGSGVPDVLQVSYFLSVVGSS